MTLAISSETGDYLQKSHQTCLHISFIWWQPIPHICAVLKEGATCKKLFFALGTCWVFIYRSIGFRWLLICHHQSLWYSACIIPILWLWTQSRIFQPEPENRKFPCRISEDLVVCNFHKYKPHYAKTRSFIWNPLTDIIHISYYYLCVKYSFFTVDFANIVK